MVVRDEVRLKNFILRHLVMLLVFVSVMQALNNVFFARFLGPFMERMLNVEGLLTGASIKEAFGILLRSVFSYIILALSGGKVYGFIDIFSKRIFSSQIFEFMGNRFATTQSESSVLFVSITVLFMIAMIVMWILPYIIAGIFFSVSVTKEVGKLQEKRITAEKEAEKQKNLLLSDIAHDIKTPITTIAGFSKALADGEVDSEKTQEYLDAIYKKSMQTTELITLLFEYVKLDSAGFSLAKEKADIMELLREQVASVYADYEEHGMEIEIEIPEEECNCMIDKVQLGRAIHNLLVNAYKHNPEKTCVTIFAEKKEKNVLIQISDNGVKIDREVAVHLFDPFVQGDKSRQTGKGSGLGLSICKKVINMHGGNIRLIQYRENPRFQKTFEVTLPFSN